MAKSENLYTDDNPASTVEGLGFKDAQTAEESISKVKSLLDSDEIDLNHAKQICVTMEQRSKHHPHRNDDMKAAENIWRGYLEELKKK
ncbi:MAG: hypothetical protein WA775_00910 [Psychroserpens sp.]|uniref:hypothetical protein n=1 Tax=Psychroserpens sp. TaxID=2020870 RepID=UPI003C70865A